MNEQTPIAPPPIAPPPTLRATRLRCEHLENPLGLDAPEPRLSWLLEAGRQGARQTAYRVLVSRDRAVLETENATGDLWNSGVVGSNLQNQIVYAGEPLTSRQICHWRVCIWDELGIPSWSDIAYWEMGLLEPGDWQGDWIGLHQWGLTDEPGPCPILRARLELPESLESPDLSNVRRARLYITARGLYEAQLNGERIGDALLAPGWTDYHVRSEYQTYALEDHLKPGENTLEVILGDGWYCGAIGYKRERRHYGACPQLLCQLEVELLDGSTLVLASSGAWGIWRVATGAIRASDMLMGEVHDARLEDRAGLQWQPVTSFPSRASKLVASSAEPVRALSELQPLSVNEPRPGVFVFDLGQNIVGWVRLRLLNASPGLELRLRFAEILDADGLLYTDSLRSARSTDVYIARGDPLEVWEPRFTFHGFRFVELTGQPGQPSLETICGIVIGSDTLATGEFECSSELVNRLYQNIVWSQRGNFLSVPTDCPQRDERLGWLGDAQIFVQTACFNADVHAFLEKWMRDVSDAQSPAGGFPNVAPRIVDQNDAAPAWGDAGVILPWTLYRHYGDTRILEQNWEAMTRWMAYIAEANSDGIWRHRRSNDFGDWLAQDGEDPANAFGSRTPKDLLASAYWAYDASLMAQMAAAIGRESEALEYQHQFERIRSAFQNEFLHEDGRLEGDTQTAYVLALHFDLIPATLRPMAGERLVALIEARGGHLTTGFVGVGYLCPVLTSIGRSDVAYRLLLNETFPSWGYSIQHGATTIWERWDGWTADKGFQDPGMNSFNHYSLGSVGQWLYQTVAGIDTLEPGFQRVLIQPQPGGGLTWVRAAHDSIRGRIESQWQLEDGQFKLRIVIPTNTTATVRLPYPTPATLEGAIDQRLEHGLPVFEVVSGTHQFNIALAPKGILI